MPLTQEEKQRIMDLPNLRESAAMVISSKSPRSVSNELTEAFTIKHLFVLPSGVLMVLQAPSGKEYRYTPSMTEYGKIRQMVMRGANLQGRTVVILFHQGSLGGGGVVFSPNLTVHIQSISAMRGGRAISF